MKREDVSRIFNGATEEQISAILDINSKDIGSAKSKADALNDQIASLNDQIKQRDADLTAMRGKLTAAQAGAGFGLLKARRSRARRPQPRDISSYRERLRNRTGYAA